MSDVAENPVVMPASEFPQVVKSSSIIVNRTYSWINNSSFYATANSAFYSFYYNNVRRIAYWLDGYDPNFHIEKNGIFSTRIGNSLVNSIGDIIFGREILFKNCNKEKAGNNIANPSLKFIQDWQKKSRFQPEVRKAIKYALGLGTSLLKLNIDAAERLWVDAVRLDYFYFEANAKGELQDVTCLLKAYSDVSSNKKQTEKDASQHQYYLVEHRYFVNEKQTSVKIEKDSLGIEHVIPTTNVVRRGYVDYLIKSYSGNYINNPSYDPSRSSSMRWDSIPAKIRESIKKDYGFIKVGEEFKRELPFDNSLGAELVLADDGNISIPSIPFGTSILENIVSYLMSYDLYYSYFVRDMYQSKGIVLMPKSMLAPQFDANNTYIDSPVSGLDESMYAKYPSMDNESNKPEQIKFDLRSEEWAKVRNMILENIATNLQMSPRTIASFLANGTFGNASQATATQVDSEDSNSVSFIESRRGILEKPINKILDIVLKYYRSKDSTLQDDVEIRFSKDGVVNTSQLIDRVTREMQSGLIDLKSALQEIMIDADEDQVNERYNAIMNEKKANLEEQMNVAKNTQLF